MTDYTKGIYTVYTASGALLGVIDNDEFIRSDGCLVARFDDDEVYDMNGSYMGHFNDDVLIDARGNAVLTVSKG